MWENFKFNPYSVNFSCDIDENFNEFDDLLRSLWDRAVTQDLFAFPINYNASRRLLEDGNLNYIIEFNQERQEKRRAACAFNQVNVPFDNKKFHFNKIKSEEILFSLDNEHQINKHLIIINNAPIRPYHVLLVPDRQLEQPQVATVDSIVFGFEFVSSSAHPYLLVGFNSLCAYASVNHLHLHGMYMPGILFAQTIKCSPFHSKTNCYLLDSFETTAFAFEVKHVDEFNEKAEYVHRITNYLTINNIAHNVTILKGRSFSSSEYALRTFVWFRQSVTNAKRFDRCNFACIELAGFMTMPCKNVYDTLTELELCQHMDSSALPSEQRYQIKEDVKALLDN